MKKKTPLIILSSLFACFILMSCTDHSSSNENQETSESVNESNQESGNFSFVSDSSDSVSWGKIY